MRALLVTTVLLSSLLVGAAPARADAPRADEDLAVIVHPKFPATSLTRAQVVSIFMRTRSTWDGAIVVPFNQLPLSPWRLRFDEIVLGMTSDQMGRHWIDERVRGGSGPPRNIQQANLTVRLVAQMPGSISYVPMSAVDGSVRVVAFVRGGKVVPAADNQKGSQ